MNDTECYTENDFAKLVAEQGVFLVSVASLALGLACTNLLMTYFVHEHGLEGRNPDRDRMFFCSRMTR